MVLWDEGSEMCDAFRPDRDGGVRANRLGPRPRGGTHRSLHDAGAAHPGYGCRARRGARGPSLRLLAEMSGAVYVSTIRYWRQQPDYDLRQNFARAARFVAEAISAHETPAR